MICFFCAIIFAINCVRWCSIMFDINDAHVLWCVVILAVNCVSWCAVMLVVNGVL